MLSSRNLLCSFLKVHSLVPLMWFCFTVNMMSHHHTEATAADVVIFATFKELWLSEGDFRMVLLRLGGLHDSHTPTLNLYTCSRTHTGSRRPCSWIRRTTSKIVSFLSAFVFLFPLFFQGCVCFPRAHAEEQTAVLVTFFPPWFWLPLHQCGAARCLSKTISRIKIIPAETSGSG